jgi:acetyl-CoA synthetase
MGTAEQGTREPFAWTPSPEVVAYSNVGQFMRRHGIASHDELIRRSTSDVAWFWDAIVADLGIEFFEPYRQVLDTSAGLPWARWFIGGEINLAHNCLDKHARSDRRDRTAIAWEGEEGAVRRLTYGELDTQTCRLANGLRALGIGKGDRVGIFLPMLPETAVAFLACAKVGAILIPIFSGYGAPAVSARLNDAGAKVLITADGFLRKGAVVPMKRVADEAAALSPTLRHTIVINRLGNVSFRPGFDIPWDELLAGQEPTAPTEPMDSEDPFLIAYTSGTTGRPKGSVHVHGGFLVKIAQEVAHQVDMHEDDTLYWHTDLGWIMGPWELVGGLARGGTVFLYEGAPDHPGPDRLWEMAERHGITILGISPTLVRVLMKYGEEPIRRHDLGRLRILASTGEPWNAAPWHWFFEHVGRRRCPIINLSGGTEVGACFLSAFPTTPLKPCSLVGPALGMDIDIFGPDGQPLREGVGELVCKTPWPAMTRGLWNDSDRYLKTYWSRWPDVWVHGDWASRDEDGQWYLHGRSDDTIKVAGKRIGPAEFESALVGHPAVAESAAIGVPDELKGEAVWCYVVLRPGHEPGEALRDELRERVARALGKAFAPSRVLFVAELPKTRNAKVLRRAIRAAALGHDPGDLSSLENPRALDAVRHAT